MTDIRIYWSVEDKCWVIMNATITIAKVWDKALLRSVVTELIDSIDEE